METKIERLAVSLKAALGASPSAAGRRLVSEPELAKLCGVSRQTLRGALDLLVADGFIVRRHGSGTYVRKVSLADGAPEQLEFPVEKIFLPDVAQASAHEPLPAQRSMVLGITRELFDGYISNKLILAGMKERAAALGHSIKMLPDLVFDDAELRLPDGYAEALRDAKCDGYIQMANSRQRFLRGVAEAFPSEPPPPAYYVWAGTWTLTDCHPLINIDTEAAVRLALSKMAAKGRKRIAMLHLAHSDWSWVKDDMDSVYRWTLGSLGLRYAAAKAILRALDSNGVAASMDALWSDGAGPDGLYVSDDHFLPAVAKWLRRRGLKPGEDLGIVTHSNNGQPLDPSCDWSQVRFTLEQMGRLSIDLLLRAVQSAGEDLCSFSHKPQWIQGRTD